MMRLSSALFIAFGPLSVSALNAIAENPVPFVNQPLVPDAAAPGGPALTLTVKGTGFTSGSVVTWNGTALATQFISRSQLTATVPPVDTAAATTALVTVENPASGGGTSNVAFFAVRAASASVAFRLASSPKAGSFPSSMAVGDFDGDGKLDLAVASSATNTVSILLQVPTVGQ